MYHIITIERQYASGGNEIGRKLAKKLGYAFHDHSILVEAAKRLEIPSAYIEDLEETSPGSVIFNLSQTALGGTFRKKDQSLPLAQKLFLEEKSIIESLVEQGSCVIVGRCAGVILKEHQDCLNLFIHADKEFRRERAIQKEKVSPAEVEAVLKKNDRRRSSFYQMHTGFDWGSQEQFDLIINSGKLGIDNTAAMLKTLCQAD